MQKNLATHKRGEATYRKHLSAFKKTFPYFIYCTPNSTRPSSLVHEVEEAKYNGAIEDIHQEEPQKLKGGGWDTLTKVSKE